MARLYRPSSVPDTDEAPTFQGGRIYRPSSRVAVDEGGGATGEGMPALNAKKGEWVDYAVSQGADPAIGQLTQKAIIEQYGPEAQAAREAAAAEAAAAGVDPAATTTQPEPVEAAKAVSVATGALVPPADPEAAGDPAATTTQPEPIEAAKQAGGDPAVPIPSSNASRDDWATYARSKGATDADLEGLGRNNIRDKYQSDLI